MGVLAGKAQSNARHRILAGLRNLGPALGAVTQRRSLRHAALRKADRILDGCVNLLLHCTLFCPTCRHLPLLQALPQTSILYAKRSKFKARIRADGFA
jgi:hypothetical protein